MKNFAKLILWGIFVAACIALPREGAGGEREEESVGWERDSEYNKLYHPEKLEKIKGVLVEIVEITPMEGMSPGMGLVMEMEERENVTVHLGPKWFTKLLVLGFNPGDPVKAKGVWAEIDGRKVFMASKVRRGEFFEVKFRTTRDGAPYWTMSDEEIIQHDERLED